MLPLGPALVASFTWAIAMRASRGIDTSSWLTHFWICCPIVIPLGFFIARQGANSVISDAADEIGDSHWMARRSLGWMVVLLIVSLLGPGVAWMGYRKLRAIIRFGRVSRDRATQALATLLGAGEGLDIFALLNSGERLEHVLSPLEYLSQYDWIGASKNGDRVWASSEARKRLKIPIP
jgi:hypothetical protein